MAHCITMRCQQVPLSGDAEWPTVADAVIEACDPIGVDDAEHRRSGQQDLRPVLMGPEEAQEPRPLGDVGEQGARVSRQPARAHAVPHTLARMPQPPGDHLTGPEAGLGGCGHGAQRLIDLVEQRRDKLHSGPGLSSVHGRVARFLTSVEEVHDPCKAAHEH